MTNLKCDVCNCESYSDHMCCKNEIKVDGGCNTQSAGETCCSSFRKSAGMKNSVAENAVPETNICCSATNCKYNSDQKCTSKYIEVNGNGASQAGQTLCSTFEPVS